MSANDTRASDLPLTHKLKARTLWPFSITASARFNWRYSSRVRACTASAREVVPGSAALSTILNRTPRRASQFPRTRPVGPAPTMRTSLRITRLGYHLNGSGHHLRLGGLRDSQYWSACFFHSAPDLSWSWLSLTRGAD